MICYFVRIHASVHYPRLNRGKVQYASILLLYLLTHTRTKKLVNSFRAFAQRMCPSPLSTVVVHADAMLTLQQFRTLVFRLLYACGSAPRRATVAWLVLQSKVEPSSIVLLGSGSLLVDVVQRWR